MQIRFQGRFIIWRTIMLDTILENKDLKSYLTLDTKGTSVGDPAPFYRLLTPSKTVLDLALGRNF